MLIVAAFVGLALICCCVAAVLGGREGRAMAALIASAMSVDWSSDLFGPDVGTRPFFRLVLDGCLLVGFAAVMLGSRRLWPIWMTGLQLNGVLAHVAALLLPDHTAVVYRGLESFWGVPIMLVMALGATLDHRADIRTGRSK